MSNDIYYYEPKQPFYAVMEEFNIVRVLAIKYLNEKPVAYLTDWGVGFDPEWYDSKHWLDDEDYGAYPFYATFEKDGEMQLGSNPISMFEKMGNDEEYYTPENIRNDIMRRLQILQVPHFLSEEDADRHHFSNDL